MNEFPEADDGHGDSEDHTPTERDSEGGVFLPISHDDPELAAASQAARSLMPFFISLLDAYGNMDGAVCSVKLDLEDESAPLEHRHLTLWVAGVQRKNDSWSGVCFETPDEVQWINAGDIVEFDDDAVQDWMVLHEGHLNGGATLRVIRERMPEESRSGFDDFLGVTHYIPLPASS